MPFIPFIDVRSISEPLAKLLANSVTLTRLSPKSDIRCYELYRHLDYLHWTTQKYADPNEKKRDLMWAFAKQKNDFTGIWGVSDRGFYFPYEGKPSVNCDRYDVGKLQGGEAEVTSMIVDPDTGYREKQCKKCSVVGFDNENFPIWQFSQEKTELDPIAPYSTRRWNFDDPNHPFIQERNYFPFGVKPPKYGQDPVGVSVNDIPPQSKL